MTIDQAANQIITWLRKAVLVVLLVSLAVILLKTFGDNFRSAHLDTLNSPISQVHIG